MLHSYAAAYGTVLSCAAPSWASFTLLKLRCTLRNYASHCWATLHQTKLWCTFLTYATPSGATLHPTELSCNFPSYPAFSEPVLRIRDVYPGSRIPDPDFYPSRIPDLGSKNSNKRQGWKNIWCHTFLFSHKFHKIVHYFSFEVLKKKIWANFQRIIELFAQQIVTKLSKVWVWDPGSGIRDPGSGIRDPEKTYSGSRIQGSKRHRIPDPQHCSELGCTLRALLHPAKLHCTLISYAASYCAMLHPTESRCALLVLRFTKHWPTILRMNVANRVISWPLQHFSIFSKKSLNVTPNFFPSRKLD